MVRWIARATLIAVACILGGFLRPLAPLGDPWGGIAPSLLLGGCAGMAAVLLDLGLTHLGPWPAAGATVGALLGASAAASWARAFPSSVLAILPILVLGAAYACAGAGARLGRALASRVAPSSLGDDSSPAAGEPKIVDTSVIIDGRIADVCETGFVEGRFVVPSFVLKELQSVADSADPLRRARGRRGLETVHRLKKCAAARIVFSEDDIPEIREVDLKLIELTRRLEGKLLTNDYNLNQVASLRGVRVLNLNDLAHALRPLVLPGESLRVELIREGKEPHQGVAYLDDGTMVVVEQARAAIGRSVDVVVTSALQTTAGKMFFARLAEGAPRSAGADLTEPTPPDRA